MKRLYLAKSVWTFFALLLIIGGVWQTCAGTLRRVQLAHVKSLEDAFSQPLYAGDYVAGTVTGLLVKPGRGLAAGKLWPVSGTDAVTGEAE